MKKIEFDSSRERFNSYNCFHTYGPGPFVEFKTGEVILTREHTLDDRKHYSRYGFHLTTTTSSYCPGLYMDKACTEYVTPAWLSQNGQQLLVIDEEQKVAIKVARAHRTKPPEVLQFLGTHLEHASAVWTGPNRLPIPLAKIIVSQPDRPLKKELAQKLDDVRSSVTAAARVRGLSPSWSQAKQPVKNDWLDKSVEVICAYLCSDETMMRTVATNGFSYPRAETGVDFLYIK